LPLFGEREQELGAFSFVDKISEVEKGQSITAFFTLKGNEEFLQDHFENFPVMPGVLLLESLKQAATLLLGGWQNSDNTHFRLDEVQEVKFGQFVKPGSLLRIFARLVEKKGHRASLEGRMDLVGESGSPIGRALTASFSLVPVQN
jgi:3-hydroxymyristoyl/3-hydroxydecanoyl-(acyl carrier protein) dehydratase